MFDARMLSQAFGNLIKNATEAIDSVPGDSPRDGKHIYVRAQREGDGYLVRVIDNGRGLPAADAKRPGALGLLGIEERCRLLGGSVAFSQTPGGGLTLLIRMPNHLPTPTPEKL